MKATMTTMVMIKNADTNQVLVQSRLLKYPGWAFPGGHVDPGESFYDCAVREVREECGLKVSNLKHCGVVHWVNRENNERYLCFMYTTTEFSGELIENSREGEHFWVDVDEMLAMSPQTFSTPKGVYSPSALFHQQGKYSEAFIPWTEREEWEVEYK